MTPRAARLALVAGLALLAAACAKKGPPSGGPPDLVPPRLTASEPDSGAAGVPRDVRPSLTFSEGMEPRTTGDAVAIVPHVEIAQQRWKGNTLTLRLADTLEADRTYTLFVGNGARDRHGNTMSQGATITFSTADQFPPGRIEGRVEARGMTAASIYLWGYEAPREPDSTARDFDALAFTDAEGRFRMAGLRVPGTYRLWAFADLNFNRSLEPRTDVLVPLDTTIVLTPGVPAALGLAMLVVNPRAEGKVSGTVVDTLGDSLGVLRVLAVSAADTTVRLIEDVVREDAFTFELAPGIWELRAFRDADRNRRYDAGREPVSDVLRVELPPAATITEQVLVLRRLPKEP